MTALDRDQHPAIAASGEIGRCAFGQFNRQPESRGHVVEDAKAVLRIATHQRVGSLGGRNLPVVGNGRPSLRRADGPACVEEEDPPQDAVIQPPLERRPVVLPGRELRLGSR